MLKITGSIFVIGATTMLGIKRSADLRERYRQMEYLRQLFYQLQSEIRYARSPLGEIFMHIGRNAKEPYDAWLLTLGKKMEEKNGGTFYGLWKTSIREALKISALSSMELERLTELGLRLGLMDVDMQVKAVELYLTGLSAALEEMREEMKQKIRLYHCLGVMSGMLIVILLV